MHWIRTVAGYIFSQLVIAGICFGISVAMAILIVLLRALFGTGGPSGEEMP